MSILTMAAIKETPAMPGEGCCVGRGWGTSTMRKQKVEMVLSSTGSNR